MIKRTPSSLNPSIVNSAHEEHFNIVKAIRDDAPITDTSSVIKSVNFESDGDGSYILRKPLIKKESLKSISYPLTYPFEFYLADKIHKVEMSQVTDTVLRIPGASKIILKFYDNDTKEHNIEFSGDSITVNWLTINSTYNTINHTLINGEIDHRLFLDTYSQVVRGSSRQHYKWLWSLVNATEWTNNFPVTPSKTLTHLKRFLKVYESTDEEDVFILEIVHPELNTFTSGLDVGNASALDANLLLDNPYAIRDLYNYGYWSTTKIVPYIVKDEATLKQPPHSLSYVKTIVNGRPIWELTESDFIPSSEQNAPNSYFRLLVSTSPTVFKNELLILKAFLTTVATPINLYCCWEESKNNGIDWEVCDEFIKKFNLTDADEHLVSDLTSKEFTETLRKESLTNAQSYLVLKKLYPLPHENYHQNDLIRNRPDVLVIENPDLSKMYRFVIYIDSNQVTPTAEPTIHTAIKPQFNDVTGSIDEGENIKYEIVNGDENSIDNQRIVLQAGDIETVEGQILPNVTVGKYLRIYTDNPLCQISSISYTLAPSRTENSRLYDVGAFIGVSSEAPENFNIPENKEFSTEASDSYTNAFAIKYNIEYLNSAIESLTCDFDSAYNATWRTAASTKTILLRDNLSKSSVNLFNISNCLYDLTTSKVYESVFRNDQYITFSPHANSWNINTSVTYNGKTLTTSSRIEDGRWHQDVIVIKILGEHSFSVAMYHYVTDDLSASTYTREVLQSPETTSYVEISAAYGYQATDSIPNRTAGAGEEGAYGYYSDYTTFTGGGSIPVDNSYTKVPVISTASTYSSLRIKGYNVTEESQIVAKIQSISVTYTLQSDLKFTSIYLISTTGNFQIAHSQNTECAKDLSTERDRLFSRDSSFYYNENQSQLLVYSKNFVYSSGTNSAIMRIMDSLSLPEDVTKIVPWRGYLLLFSPKNIYLASYNSSSDNYDVRILSNTVGVSKEDADTVVPILNSVYFKSGAKIYKLVPNLYAASDNILNIHQISTGINNILESIVNTYIEKHNFGYSDSDIYMVFIPIENLQKTYCITYDFNKKLWNLYEYPLYLNGIDKFSMHEGYVYSDTTLFYFKERLTYLITQSLRKYCVENDINFEELDVQRYVDMIPYTDYLTTSPDELIPMVLENTGTTSSVEATFNPIMTPIDFEIDFGQKSSNYTLYKQFLETKFTLATLSARDNFPFELKIYTNGMPQLINLKWDCNTDGALWKKTLDDLDILNTDFATGGTEFNGIMRQLIVKYSGRGKTIRHVFSGKSKSLFKIYSMDVRGRILPKKQ